MSSIESNIKPVVTNFPAMGTHLELVLYHENRGFLQALVSEIEEEVSRLEAKMSRFIPTSEVSRINRLAALEPVLVDHEMFAILQLAQDFYYRTGGVFDITIAPLLRKWGFYQKNYQVLDAKTIKEILTQVGGDQIELDSESRTVYFKKKGMEIDLGGMGKGYTLGIIVDMLRENAISTGLISFGGSSIYGLGAPPTKESWQFSFKISNQPQHPTVPVKLKDKGFSVSANYNRQFTVADQSYGHIFDPGGGSPVQGLMAAAVLHDSPLEAEVLSTAFMVMGLEKSRTFLEKNKEVRAILALISPDDSQLRIEKFNFEEV